MKNLKNNNKGFSLVELIVVIAIMVVLAVALAPVFTKFVEQSRRATDVSNAATIAEAILVEAADNPSVLSQYDSSTALPDALKSWPAPQGKIDGTVGTDFIATYNSTTNTVEVTVDGLTESYNLANPTHGQNYKDGKKPDGSDY